jgi:hypothetical protein
MVKSNKNKRSRIESVCKTNIAFDTRWIALFAVFLLMLAISLLLTISLNMPKNWRVPGLLALTLNPLVAYFALSQVFHGHRTSRLLFITVISTLGTLLSWSAVFAFANGMFDHW